MLSIVCMLAITLLAAVAPAKAGGYLGPIDLDVSADGRTVYVACADARQVLSVSLPSGRVTRRWPLPAEPTGVRLTPDGTRLAVTCAAARSRVLVLDTRLGAVVFSIEAGNGACGPAFDRAGQRLYVCNRFSNDVSIIDMGSGIEAARVPAVREPIAAAVVPGGRTVLVANHLPVSRTDLEFRGNIAAAVTVIDARTLETSVIELPHGASGVRGIGVLPDGSHAFVTHLLSNFENVPFRLDMGWVNVNVVSIIDLRARQWITTIGMDDLDRGAANPWDIACSADGKLVCVTSAGTHELGVITTRELLGEEARRTMSPVPTAWPVYPSLGDSLWKKIKLPGKGPRAVALQGKKVFVAEYFSDTLAGLDLDADEEPNVRTIPLGPPPKLTLQRQGELLFHDATICYQHWQSCASCHPDGRSDALRWDLMNDGVGNPKNTKSMLLADRTPPAMSKGVRESAERAVRSGVEHILFAERPEAETRAIYAYVRSLRSVPGPYLDAGHFTAAAERGRVLFESRRVGCARCHPAPLYTDMRIHSMGQRRRGDRDDRFDTPTLVEVWRTAPYLHDGRYATVKDLLDEGRHGRHPGRGRELSDQELRDLVEFVLSL